MAFAKHRFEPDPRSTAPPAIEPAPTQPDRRRGRGSASNRSGRFEQLERISVDDGWEAVSDLPPLATDVQIERARRIITKNDSPDISFSQSINPYRGCEHGCAYCFARPTHAFMGLSPGLDFETKLFAKPGAARLLEREISKPGYVPQVIAIGTNTDPYQPIERRYRIMRDILTVLAEANHPVAILTKNALVTRDIDLLEPMAEKGLVKVGLSVTTLDRRLARTMEPRASTPPKRLEALRRLSNAGVPTSVMFAPVIPGLNEPEMERVLDAAKAQGAREAGYVLLRLTMEVADLFKEFLKSHYPDRYERVMSLVRSMRGGKDYDSSWGQRMSGSGPYAWQIGRRFEIACGRLGLNTRRQELRTDAFAPINRSAQLSLL